MSERRSYNRKPHYKGKGRRDFKKSKTKKGTGFYLPTGTIVYVLDILPHGRMASNDNKWIHKPLIQAMEAPGFNLFEMEYNKDANIQLQEKIVIQRGPNAKVGKVIRRLSYHKLTQTSKDLLQSTIELHLQDREDLYVNFLNNAGPITQKRHSLNLIPGIGEKLMWEIIKARETKKFESFEDFEKRVGIRDIKSLISKRISNEIIDDEARHYLFVKRKANLQSKKTTNLKKKNYRR
ncbi:MAG: DUF655 domain-containing protein [Promethearchaeota archaeon]